MPATSSFDMNVSICSLDGNVRQGHISYVELVTHHAHVDSLSTTFEFEIKPSPAQFVYQYYRLKSN